MRPSRPPAPPPPIRGPTPFGDYILVERIGVGGMAEVFRAETRPAAGAPRTIVIKRMLPHIAQERGSAQMFEDEARLAMQVEHPNVVRVLHRGDVEGQPYLALELVPGRDVARLVRWLREEERALDPMLAVFIGVELLAGLHAVHEARDSDGSPLGIVHGDVSPSNLMVSSRGDVKLGDFGIAEARLRKSFPQAAAGRTKGKLAYLSPEHVRGDERDRRSDVFAASVVIAELAMAEPLFSRGSELSTLLAVRDANVQALHDHAAHMPDDLLAALLRGLAREPSERFPDAASMRIALSPILDRPLSQLRTELGALVAEMAGDEPEDDTHAEAQTLTLEPPLDDYFVVRDEDGETVGPLSFAQLVESVTTGRVSRNDRVRVGKGPLRPLRTFAELAGHFPESGEHDALGTVLDINSGEFLDGLALSIATRATGVWICANDDVKKEVYLIDGSPEFVSSNLPSEMLGEFLVTSGVLARSELDMALAVLPRFEGRLGDTLAALGLVEPVELFGHIAAQVREKLLELFQWDGGAARFHAGVAPPERSFPLRLDPWRVLSDGIDRRLEAGLEQDRFALHMLDLLERTAASPPDSVPGTVLDVLTRTRRAAPLQDVVESLEDPTNRDRHRPYRAIRLALALGLVRWREPR